MGLPHIPHGAPMAFHLSRIFLRREPLAYRGLLDTVECPDALAHEPLVVLAVLWLALREAEGLAERLGGLRRAWVFCYDLAHLSVCHVAPKKKGPPKRPRD